MSVLPQLLFLDSCKGNGEQGVKLEQSQRVWMNVLAATKVGDSF